MGIVDEIISKYAANGSHIEEFGRWLLQDRDSAVKDEALAELWTDLETKLFVDDASAREAKFAVLVKRLEEQGAVLSARPHRRLVWARPVFFAVAAAIAIVVLLWMPDSSSSDVSYEDSGVGLIAELPHASSPEAMSFFDAGTAVVKEDRPAFQTESAKVDSLYADIPVSQTAEGAEENMSEDNSQRDQETFSAMGQWESLDTEDSPAQRRKHGVLSFGAFAAGLSVSRTSAGEAATPGVTGFGDPLISGDNMHSDKQQESLPFPVKAGISLSYGISSLTTVETGIVFSRVGATYGRGNYDYLGIPLSLNHTVVSKHYYQLYLSAGGEAAFCISSSSQPVQFSLMCSAGVQVPLSKFAGIYLEPSANYYIPAYGGDRTYYTENPFSFGLEVGIRFNLTNH